MARTCSNIKKWHKMDKKGPKNGSIVLKMPQNSLRNVQKNTLNFQNLKITQT
jgi:hypothetical protein